MGTVTVDDEQVRWFRARRLGLVDGFDTANDAAKRILGAQAQVEACALQSLAQRVPHNPTADALTARLEHDRSLVRCWAQRDTMHIFDVSDWATVIAAQQDWPQSGRRHQSPSDDVIAEGLRFMQDAQAPVSREDLFHLITDDYAQTWIDFLGCDETTARRNGVGRIFWNLCRNGDIAAAGKRGSQQLFVARTVWWPDLPWSPPDSETANIALVRRYLAVSAPASPADVAYHLGARVSDARRWLAALSSETIPVSFGDRNELVALAEDADALQERPGDWPTRLLPGYDMKWMSHKDKSVVTPVKTDEKSVWGTAARVAACVVHRGQPVATWKMKKRKRAVDITVTPLSKWSGDVLSAVETDAQRVARHLGRDEAIVSVV